MDYYTWLRSAQPPKRRGGHDLILNKKLRQGRERKLLEDYLNGQISKGQYGGLMPYMKEKVIGKVLHSRLANVKQEILDAMPYDNYLEALYTSKSWNAYLKKIAKQLGIKSARKRKTKKSREKAPPIPPRQPPPLPLRNQHIPIEEDEEEVVEEMMPRKALFEVSVDDEEEAPPPPPAALTSRRRRPPPAAQTQRRQPKRPKRRRFI